MKKIFELNENNYRDLQDGFNLIDNYKEIYNEIISEKSDDNLEILNEKFDFILANLKKIIKNLSWKNTYTYEGQIRIGSSDRGIYSNYYSIFLTKDTDQNQVKGQIVGSIDIKRNSKNDELFAKFANTNKTVSVTFELGSNRIVNFKEINDKEK